MDFLKKKNYTNWNKHKKLREALILPFAILFIFVKKTHNMKLTHIPTSTLKFIKDLKKNNNREWFNQNKPRYQEENQLFKKFANTLLDEMSKIDNIEADKPFRKILKSASFKKMFGTLEGATLKTAPRGFEKDHPAVDLLRYKQFIVYRKFSDKEIKDPKFVKEMVKTYKAMHPFFNYMSEVLTTDSNGVSIVD